MLPGDQSVGTGAWVDVCELLSLIMTITVKIQRRFEPRGYAVHNRSRRKNSELGEATLENTIKQG